MVLTCSSVLVLALHFSSFQSSAHLLLKLLSIAVVSTIIQSLDSDWIISDIDLHLGASYQNRVLALIPQQCLSALSVLFIYPALYEFICAQSPHSMKGLFIGLTFAVKRFF